MATTRTQAQARQQANRSSGQTLPPLAPPAPKWGGGLGFIFGNGLLSGLSYPAFWNANMRAGDIAGASSPTQYAANVGLLTVGRIDPGLQITTVASLSNADLSAIDVAATSALGAGTTVYLRYADDNFTGTYSPNTIPGKVNAMAYNISLIRNFPRAGGAVPFKGVYLPSGTFLQQNIASIPTLGSYPDGLIFQTQPFEDTPVGADPTYVSTCNTVMAQIKATGQTGPIVMQVQVFSKSVKSTVWTTTKMIQDINAIGIANNPAAINIYFLTPSAAAAAQTCFINTLANYRP
jgi:hypothetical protein